MSALASAVHQSQHGLVRRHVCHILNGKVNLIAPNILDIRLHDAIAGGKYRRRKTPTLTNVAVTLNTLTNPNLTLSKKLEAAHPPKVDERHSRYHLEG